MSTFTTQRLAELVSGELKGPPELSITGVEQVELAQPGQLTFIGNEKYVKLWPACRASAALVSRSLASQVVDANGSRAIIVVGNADIAMAAALELFAPPRPIGGVGSPAAALAPANPLAFVHPTAVVDPSARLGDGARIGANCVVGPRVTIGPRTVLYPNVVVLDDSAIGADGLIWPGVVVRDRCTIGDRCIIHPNVSIGADGFGFRPDPKGGGLLKIPQIGTVEIGNDVEIGAGSCVDRGKFSATLIGDGCKIDNLCQIAHNCRLGRCVILAGCASVAGSVTIGDGAMLGGCCSIADHITIGAGAKIVATSAVMRDVAPGEKVAGAPARESRQLFREIAALAKLPDALKEMRKQRD